MART
ncbi:hypothetical protein MTR67_019005 [Solanum verrucosum]|jgi:hypothetical protein